MNSIFFMYNIGTSIFDKIIQEQKFLADIKLITNKNLSKLYGCFYDTHNNY